MCEREGELPTPPEIIKTIDILAPKGSPLEQKIAAIQLAAELYQAKLKPSPGQQENEETK